MSQSSDKILSTMEAIIKLPELKAVNLADILMELWLAGYKEGMEKSLEMLKTTLKS